ncbi:MAG: primosomal protein N' [Chloroflexota bacterium]|nr:primosomal protein N' [Chloroflexota bacterium]
MTDRDHRSSSPSSFAVAEIAVDGVRPDRPAGAPGDGLLSYAVPDEWRGQLAIGQLVWVPLRKQLVLGIVLRLHNEPPALTLKPLHAAVEPPIRLHHDQIALADWLARECASTRYAALALCLPPGVSHRVVHFLELTGSGWDIETLTPAQRKLVNLVQDRAEITLDAARTALESPLTTVVPKLEARGVLRLVPRVSQQAPHPKVERFLRLVPGMTNGHQPRGERQQAVLEFLTMQARLEPEAGNGLVSLADTLMRTSADHGVIAALARKGIIEEVFLPRLRVPLEGPAADPVPLLTADQARAWAAIEDQLAARDPSPFLLHGVTGSGKTEVYLRAVAWCLRHGRSAIVLVPEIALATQVVRRFIARFPGRVAVLHSALADTERHATWQALAEGRYQVVVGPRSALFAPARDLGLIILDEEHDSAYKQDNEPRYHARAVAEHLAAEQGAVVILGSATPAVETFWRAETAAITRLELPERVGPDLGQRGGSHNRAPLALPPVDIVDMRLELHRGNTSLFSEALREVLARTLAANEQTLLFLNRRGLATVVLCKDCGARLLCPYCDIPLVFHADRKLLLCHRCNHRERPPAACPSCRGTLNYFGAGTQRVEQDLRRLLPSARILRWDQDAVRQAKGHDRLLRRVERHEVDVVVGTQMIAKGFDLPLVTAIGVIHADTMLHLPDFRAGERTFQLLTQVAGRAGRRTAGSSVVVQSYTPEHYAIQAASHHDYVAFFAEEIDFRRTHQYPPFTRLARYTFRHEQEAACAAEADEMARALARHARRRGVTMDLLGPSPAFVGRIRGRYQWQIVLRSTRLESLLDGLPARPGWVVDIDPQSLL